MNTKTDSRIPCFEVTGILFILLKLTDRKDSLKNRLHNVFFSPEFEIERVEMRDAAPFFVMTCPKYKGRVPYNLIASVVGKLSDKIVCEKNLEFFEDSPIKPFSGRKLKRQLLINSAIKILSDTKNVNSVRELVIIDEWAVYTEKIERLAECVRNITVLTNFPDRYKKAAERMKERHGLCLNLIKGTYFDFEHGVVISDKAENVTPYFKGLLFSNDENVPPCCHSVIGHEINLKIYTDYEFSSKFDSVEIGEAMYELCYAGKLGDLKYNTLSFDGIEYKYEEISNLCLNSTAEYCK